MKFDKTIKLLDLLISEANEELVDLYDKYDLFKGGLLDNVTEQRVSTSIEEYIQQHKDFIKEMKSAKNILRNNS